MIVAMFIIGAFVTVAAGWQMIAGDPHPADHQALIFTIAIGGLIMLAAVLLRNGAAA